MVARNGAPDFSQVHSFYSRLSVAENRRLAEIRESKVMQILTSGSFINLESGEKIEQLIFTAKAIADSAIQTDGFTSSEENNQRLALEIWQGAEYMTREHERARIQNLFVNNFLERLREVAPASSATDNLPEIVESAAAENSPVEADASKDEFLGFVSSAAENEIQEIAAENDAVAENAEAINSAEISAPSDEAAPSVRDGNSERETIESVEDVASEAVETQTIEPESDKAIETNREIETSIAEVSQIVKAGSLAIAAITLPEKEPYRWEDCLVTATIQLLPVEAGRRRVVVSVKTHDFAPQISLAELSGAEAATPESLARSLGEAFEKYKNDLPVKVMDKMKREKSSGKKQTSKTAQDAKTNSPVSNQSGQSQTKAEAKSVQASVAKPESSQTAAPAASQTVAAQLKPPVAASSSSSKASVRTSKPQDSAQGNLFGF